MCISVLSKDSGVRVTAIFCFPAPVLTFHTVTNMWLRVTVSNRITARVKNPRQAASYYSYGHH